MVGGLATHGEPKCRSRGRSIPSAARRRAGPACWSAQTRPCRNRRAMMMRTAWWAGPRGQDRRFRRARILDSWTGGGQGGDGAGLGDQLEAAVPDDGSPGGVVKRWAGRCGRVAADQRARSVRPRRAPARVAGELLSDFQAGPARRPGRRRAAVSWSPRRRARRRPRVRGLRSRGRPNNPPPRRSAVPSSGGVKGSGWRLTAARAGPPSPSAGGQERSFAPWPSRARSSSLAGSSSQGMRRAVSQRRRSVRRSSSRGRQRKRPRPSGQAGEGDQSESRPMPGVSARISSPSARRRGCGRSGSRGRRPGGRRRRAGGGGRRGRPRQAP